MKTTAMLMIFVMVSSFSMTGCSTTGQGPTPAQYSFAKGGQETASINFIFSSGSISDEIVYFVDYEGSTVPEPKEGTYWERTMLFPAGVPLKLNVYVVRDRQMLMSNMGSGSLDFSGVSGEGALGLIILLPVIVVGALIMLPIDAIAAATGDRFKYVTFECPPLEAGGVYELKFNYRWLINDELILTNIRTEKGLFGNRRVDKRIVAQTFKATLKERDPDRH